MSDIVKSILGGGWSLVAGWILPTAINAVIFSFLVWPSLRSLAVAGYLAQASGVEVSIAVLGSSVVIGLAFSAIQVPLYRILEGYLWPPGLARRMRQRRLRSKQLLADRLVLIRLRALESRGRLVDPADKKKLELLASDSRLEPFDDSDQARTAVQRALLRERLRRYPVEDAQVAPTRLGNAIRRHEEYGYQRYRLDSQALWYELTAAAPRELSQQVDAARTGVDFFVCLLYGHLVVAALALATLAAAHAHHLTLAITVAIMTAASCIWYQLAVITTDDWALAVRALVDIGRVPLAKALGFRLPADLETEREMWQRYSQFVRRPYSPDDPPDLDKFRADS